MYLYGILRYSDQCGLASSIKEIHIIDINPDVLTDIKEVFTNKIPKDQDYHILDPALAHKRHSALMNVSTKQSNDATSSIRKRDSRTGSQVQTSHLHSNLQADTGKSKWTSDVSVIQLPDDKIRGVTSPIKGFEFENGLIVKMYTGSLVKFSGDAIVCSTDAQFSGGGPLAKAVSAAGGDSYDKSFSKMRPKIYETSKVKVGSVHECDGGRLKVHKVYHVVIDTVLITSPHSMKEYFDTLENMMEGLNRQTHVRRIAMPLVGAGNTICDSVISHSFKYKERNYT